MALGSGGIQTAVGGLPAPGVAGDFADSNPGYRVLSGPGGLVSGSTAYGIQPVSSNPGSGTAIVGRFGWLSQQVLDPDNAATIVNSFWTPNSGVLTAVTGIVGASAPDGFISRPDSPAIIPTYLADATMIIQQGAPVPLWAGGRAFWCVNDGTTAATVGMKAYADLATGKVSFAVSGSASYATSSAASVAAGTWSATGSISGNVMTVGTVTGYVAPGATVTGASVATGTVVVNQLTGVAGAAGTYTVSIGEQTVAAGTSLSGTYGIMTVGGSLTGTGSFEIGGVVRGSLGSFVAGTMITGYGTGNGGAGTYYVSNNTVVTPAAAISFTNNVETQWTARSGGGAGELIKISTIIQ
jgi:hypothetical protein